MIRHTGRMTQACCVGEYPHTSCQMRIPIMGIPSAHMQDIRPLAAQGMLVIVHMTTRVVAWNVLLTCRPQ